MVVSGKFEDGRKSRLVLLALFRANVIAGVIANAVRPTRCRLKAWVGDKGVVCHGKFFSSPMSAPCLVKIVPSEHFIVSKSEEMID